MTSSRKPSFRRLIESYEDFLACAKDLAHFAFKRPFKYFHHILLKAKEEIVEFCVSLKNILTGVGEVQEAEFSENDIRKAIKNKELYFINAQDYPKTEAEKEAAHKRCKDRVGNKMYRVACNNCEHLVTFILTGRPYSDQIKNATAWKMVIVDTFDACVCQATSIFSSLGCFPIWIYGAGLKPIGVSLLFTGVLEGCITWRDINQLKVMRQKNHINEKDYQREVFKRKREAITATIGSVIGGCLGAILPLPVLGPFVGSAVGSFLGNVAGRVLGSVFSGRYFDYCYGK